ncbi:MAG: glycosyltransferase [Bacilli bacterium]|nr:glycosyltransferase [Bacilli bacterium]
MPKFSIVIPAYNVEQYIGRCLESVFNQTSKDYEVIVVDDGCTDKSIEIAKDYDVKIVTSKHVSVSEARNLGAKKAKGEYLLFLDSDDYWDKDLLKEIKKSLDNNPDLVRFQVRTVTNNYETVDYEETTFKGKTGVEAFAIISRFHFVESVWCYAIKREYYEKEKFSFAKGKVHEDFGLTPLIIIKAGKVNSINYIGYNYYRRQGSIMNQPDYEWTKHKVNDFYNHYLFLSKEINKTDLDSKLFKSFIANSLILKICELKGKDYLEYKKKLKEHRVYDYLLTNTFGRKIKKLLFMISPKFTNKLINK